MNIILLEKSNSFFYAQLKYPAMLSEKLLKVLWRDCVVTRFNIEQRFLARSHSINHHMPYSHDRGYPKKSHLEETVSVTHLLLWRRVTAILEQRIDWRLFPSKTEWPFWNSWDTGAYQTSLECFCLITSILGLRGTWNVFCFSLLSFQMSDILDLVLKYCLQLQ